MNEERKNWTCDRCNKEYRWLSFKQPLSFKDDPDRKIITVCAQCHKELRREGRVMIEYHCREYRMSNEQDIDGADILAAVVRQDTDDLTDQEFAAICQALLLNMDVRRVKGYEKVVALFTEEDGAQMEQATREVFQSLFRERAALRRQMKGE
jgi:hypothetical protein